MCAGNPTVRFVCLSDAPPPSVVELDGPAVADERAVLGAKTNGVKYE